MSPTKIEQRLKALSVIVAGLLAVVTGLTILLPRPFMICCVVAAAVSTGVTWCCWHVVRRSNRAARSDVH